MPEATFVWVGGRPFKAMTEGVARINKQMEHAPSNLTFAGMIELESMPLAYNAADMMLFLSYQENSPLAPIEAAACGLPVVFRDLPEYKSLYENAYITGNDNEAFIHIARQLMHDRLFYTDAVKISTNLIKQFDKNIIREKLLKLYTRLYERYLIHARTNRLKASIFEVQTKKRLQHHL
jgi:1,2-diacylglycerol-3-alpha-glucose alpha-1,2-galactosyltransferase